MIKINLLPFRAARRKENIRRQITIYVLAVVLVLLLAGWQFMDLTVTLSNLADTKAEKEKELVTYASTLKKIDKLDKTLKIVKDKLAVINGLKENKTGPVLLLDEIATAIPKDKLWLTSLSERAGTLTLNGTAMDNDTVAVFMTNLQNSARITSVDLKSARLKNLTKYKLRVTDFSLICKTYFFKEKKKTSKPGKRGRR